MSLMVDEFPEIGGEEEDQMQDFSEVGRKKKQINKSAYNVLTRLRAQQKGLNQVTQAQAKELLANYQIKDQGIKYDASVQNLPYDKALITGSAQARPYSVDFTVPTATLQQIPQGRSLEDQFPKAIYNKEGYYDRYLGQIQTNIQGIGNIPAITYRPLDADKKAERIDNFKTNSTTIMQTENLPNMSAIYKALLDTVLERRVVASKGRFFVNAVNQTTGNPIGISKVLKVMQPYGEIQTLELARQRMALKSLKYYNNYMSALKSLVKLSRMSEAKFQRKQFKQGRQSVIRRIRDYYALLGNVPKSIQELYSPESLYVRTKINYFLSNLPQKLAASMGKRLQETSLRMMKVIQMNPDVGKVVYDEIKAAQFIERDRKFAPQFQQA